MTDHVPAILEALDIPGEEAPKSGTQQMLQRPLPALPKKRYFVKNAILTRLSLQDLAAIGELLEPIVLRKRMVVQEPKRHLDHVYFVESGLVSLRVVAEGSILETAVIGYQGAVGASLLVGGHLSSHQAVVLFPGSAYRIRVEDLRRVMNERPEIRDHVSQYVQALNLHCAQAGLCGTRHDREKRLASWLCLASDAVDAPVLPVTHDYLSSVLGLRRAGVTETLIRFEEQGLIRKMRGVLQIDERKSLEQRACCCYKLVSSAYAPSQSDDLRKRVSELANSPEALCLTVSEAGHQPASEKGL
ncbi:Crp/Fnr family transcriptional regulator [Bradyrhizobium brasilense]|uniref:Crp/Fnr family transcriptional regulator n=1 Tax=Bradyrhizobium brasilense TaxID=1419277 RepID=UPI001E458B5F|nr:Crp/Fnr family transcriptional regulator [Bradyrhizobium brasilense]MCC8968946.1 Crp/Fnr family transcriptional regulator [Bradyrhizobium brasilense]